MIDLKASHLRIFFWNYPYILQGLFFQGAWVFAEEFEIDMLTLPLWTF